MRVDEAGLVPWGRKSDFLIVAHSGSVGDDDDQGTVDPGDALAVIDPLDLGGIVGGDHEILLDHARKGLLGGIVPTEGPLDFAGAVVDGKHWRDRVEAADDLLEGPDVFGWRWSWRWLMRDGGWLRPSVVQGEGEADEFDHRGENIEP